MGMFFNPHSQSPDRLRVLHRDVLKKFKLTRIEFRSFLILLLACIISNVLLLPYISSLLNTSHISSTTQLFSVILNGLIIYPIPIYVGLLLKKIVPVAGLTILEGLKRFDFNDFLKFGLLTGLIAGVLILLLELFFIKMLPDLKSITPPGRFYGFLASFYGGIVEEVLMRLFLLSLLLVFLRRFNALGIWVAILSVAVIFGLGHLPTTVKAYALSSASELPALMIVRALLLNGIVGVACGWLYWKKGLEYAISSHFMTDLVIHVLWPI